MVQEYDVIVIGAGPAGENIADRAVKKGQTMSEIWLRLLETYGL